MPPIPAPTVIPDSAMLDGNVFAHPASETTLTVRLLVDHSVMEVFAQGGRAVATYPFCPPSPQDDAVFLVNQGPDALVLVAATLNTVATANVIP